MPNPDRETVLIEPDGSRTVVRTNESGTTVTNGDRTVYTSGGDRHDDQVRQSRAAGARDRTDFDDFPEFDND